MTGRRFPIGRLLPAPRMVYCRRGHARCEYEERCGWCRLEDAHARQRRAETIARWLREITR